MVHHSDTEDFLQVVQEGYTSTVDTDRGMGNAIAMMVHKRQLMEGKKMQDLAGGVDEASV